MKKIAKTLLTLVLLAALCITLGLSSFAYNSSEAEAKAEAEAEKKLNIILTEEKQKLQKAEYTKTLFPYFIGAVLIFAASNLADMIYSWASTIK